jgi:tripartite-type tricarboxylate transporter receptor subunit TctC
MAQNYPDKPIKLIVPYPAGQASDSIARLVGERLSR